MMDVQQKTTPSHSVRCVWPLLLSVCYCQSRRMEPEEIHRPVLNHKLVQERPTIRHAVQTSLWQLSKVYVQGCPDVCSSIRYKRPSVQAHTAMEKVTCSCNMVEDHLPAEDSQPSLVTRTFYLNDKQNKHIPVGLFPSHNFCAHVMFSSNSKRLILTLPQWNFIIKEIPFWTNSVENCVKFVSNMDDFSI
uniref:Uncharacterized protein n=1 Tax=Timema monikensis TaxID=170555 RepID=A0A7R9HMT8_9NEOP|nr:unnamed protein product [Timema monikensis]